MNGLRTTPLSPSSSVKRPVPIEWIADEAQKNGLGGDADPCARWLLLGFHLGRMTASGQANLLDEQWVREQVRTITGGRRGD